MEDDLDLPNKSPNAPAQTHPGPPNLLTLPTEILPLISTHLRPTPHPTKNIVFLSHGEHGICYSADGRHRCDELRGLVYTLSRMDQRLGDVASMALRDEEELESDVLARCRQRIRDAVRAGCDWKDLICVRLSLEDEVDRMMDTAWDMRGALT
jgi:hypothetical protein